MEGGLYVTFRNPAPSIFDVKAQRTNTRHFSIQLYSIGSRHVAPQMYRLTWNGTVIRNSKWRQTVRPGSQVIISGLISNRKTTGESCPKPGCHGQGMRRGNTSLYECRQCGVMYAEDQGGQGSVKGKVEDDDTISSDLCADPVAKDESEEARFRRTNVIWDLGNQSSDQTAEMDQASTQPEVALDSPTDGPSERTMERNQAPTREEVENYSTASSVSNRATLNAPRGLSSQHSSPPRNPAVTVIQYGLGGRSDHPTPSHHVNYASDSRH